MANNIAVLDGAGASQTVKTTDTAGVHTPHHNVDSSALPTGAATAANQTTIIGHVDGIETVLGTIDTDTGGIATSAASIDGKITACNTGAVVVSSSALPTGAATAAKQPALGTAGTASADVISVQGIASMTPLQVSDGGGSLTVDGTVAVSSVGGSVAVTGTFWQATQPVSLASVPSHDVTNAGTFAVQITGAALTALQLIDDAIAGTEMQVDVVAALPAGTNNIGDVDVLTLPALNGSVAHDSADSGAPHKVGAKATTALSGLTLVANADRTDLFAGVDGVLITRPHCNLEDQVQERVTNTDGASTDFAAGFAAPGAGVRLYLTSLVIANSSSSNCTVDIRDGAAGSVLLTVPVPANSGVIFNPPVPLKFSANTAAAYDASAAISTLSITAIGFKSKV